LPHFSNDKEQELDIKLLKDMMEEKEMNGNGGFSKAVKAGKRTYFFDVKATRNDEKYITITESKRRIDENTNQFFYEKHKIFLYKEDFEKVAKGLNDAIKYVETGELPADYYDDPEPTPRHYDRPEAESHNEIDSAIDRWFDSLDK
jgi:hypothetical protein